MRNSTPGKNPAAPVPARDPLPTDVRRRRFLFTLGAGSAGAAAAVAGTLHGTAAVQLATAQANDADAGYRVTEHVRDYYRSAKI